MDATLIPRTSRPAIGSPPVDVEKRTELILDALKAALADPGEHRLFRSGKLAGLFPARTGPAAAAALRALSEGLLETVRTETKGKLLVEWVVPTSKALGYVADHDSPKAVLRELREVIGRTRDAVPDWMTDAKTQVAALAERFEAQAAAMMQRLDALADRVDAALRRAETAAPRLPEPITALVPWAMVALEYLDRRRNARQAGECPLAELFAALRESRPDLAVPEFHTGLQRLHDSRTVRLVAVADDPPDPEFALIVGADVCSHVTR